jgi:phosphatidylinositol kinase/protein kinase (PI-3  family)
MIYLNNTVNEKKLIYIVPFYYNLLFKFTSAVKSSIIIIDHINAMNAKVSSLIYPLIINQQNMLSDEERKSVASFIANNYLSNQENYVYSIIALNYIKDSSQGSKKCFDQVLDNIKHNKDAERLITQHTDFFKHIINISDIYRINDNNDKKDKYKAIIKKINKFLENKKIIFPLLRSNKYVEIKCFKEEFKAIASLTKPIVMSFTGKDNKTYSLLYKFDKLSSISETLTHNLIKAFNNIYSRTINEEIEQYNILPINESIILIEWVDEITSIGNAWKDEMSYEGLCHYDEIDVDLINQNNFLYNYFIRKNAEPNEYFSFKNNFIKSWATSSIAIKLIGLGNRHTNNIFFLSNGNDLHIDFGIVFNYSLILKVPEIIPFRLTNNIRFAFGLLERMAYSSHMV